MIESKFDVLDPNGQPIRIVNEVVYLGVLKSHSGDTKAVSTRHLGEATYVVIF